MMPSLDRLMPAQLSQSLRGAPLLTFAAGIVLCLILTGIGVFTLPGLEQLDGLADRDNPYFIVGHAGFLYLLIPLTMLAACLAVLAPGLLLSLALSKGDDTLGVWVLKGAALSTLIVSLMAYGLQILLGGPVIGSVFLAGLTALTIGCFAFAFIQNRKAHFSWQFLRGRLPDITLALVVPGLTLLLLSPKFYWEDFTGDGAHLFAATLQYVQTGTPFWASGVHPELSSFPTLNAMLQFFAASWFMRLFGESAFALRMVYLFGAMLLAVTLMDFARFRHQMVAPWRVACAIGAGLLLFAYALAFNGTYDAYFADIGLPMSREPLIVVTFLGFVMFGWMKRYAWMAVFAALSYMAAPNGLILMGFWSGAVFLVSSRVWPVNLASFRTWPILETAIKLGVIGGVVIGFSLLESVLVGSGAASFGSEFGGEAILERLRYVSIDTWQRFAYWILPAGILPVAALAFWFWQDRFSRAMTLTILFYFGFFYIQGFRILPHHFAPIMLLPMIVLWRLAPQSDRLMRAILPAAALVSCAVAALLIAPSHMQIHRVGSHFAATIEIEDVSLSPVDAEAYIAFGELFAQAFPRANSESASEERYIGASIAWYVQALQPKASDQTINYVVRRPGVSLGNDETLIAEWEGWTVTSMNTDQYIADRDRAGIPSSINPILYVPRDVVFGRGERWGNRRVFDLLDQAEQDAEDKVNEGQ